MLGYFGQKMAGPCGHCDNCASPAATVDATQDARKLLSTVARTGQRFGIRHVVRVLRGKVDETICRYGHDRLSVFGIGQDRGEAHWRELIGQLVCEGLIGQTEDRYRTLHLTPPSVPLLRGERTFEIPSRRGSRKPPIPKPVESAEESPEDEKLFEALRELRRTIARREGMAPYMVFSNVTLRELARRRPHDRESLLEVRGVGEHKAQRYGAVFLEAITNQSGEST